MVLEKHHEQEVVFGQHDPRRREQRLRAPGLGRDRELEGQVEVPVDKVRLDLDMLFLVFAGLHLLHLHEGDGHQAVSEHGRVEESHLSDPHKSDKKQEGFADAAGSIAIFVDAAGILYLFVLKLVLHT